METAPHHSTPPFFFPETEFWEKKNRVVQFMLICRSVSGPVASCFCVFYMFWGSRDAPNMFIFAKSSVEHSPWGKKNTLCICITRPGEKNELSVFSTRPNKNTICAI